MRSESLTNGTDCTGPSPDGPAIGSVRIGLVIPPLVATRPLVPDVHVAVVVFTFANELPPAEALPFPDDGPFPLPSAELDAFREGACASVGVFAVDAFADDGTVSGDEDESAGTEFIEFELIVILIPAKGKRGLASAAAWPPVWGRHSPFSSDIASSSSSSMPSSSSIERGPWWSSCIETEC